MGRHLLGNTLLNLEAAVRDPRPLTKAGRRILAKLSLQSLPGETSRVKVIRVLSFPDSDWQ